MNGWKPVNLIKIVLRFWLDRPIHSRAVKGHQTPELFKLS